MRCKKCSDGQKQGQLVKYAGGSTPFLNHYICKGGVLRNGVECSHEYTNPTALGKTSGLVTEVGGVWVTMTPADKQ